MFRSCVKFHWIKRILVAGVVSAALAGCGGGGGGGTGVPGGSGGTVTPPPSASPYAKPPATALNMTINSVTVPTTPPVRAVVVFSVTNETGARYTGLLPADLRFNIAKLIPAAGGKPTSWQSYINTAKTVGAVTAFRGTTETATSYQRYNTQNASAPGALADHGDGYYTYTFNTDISNVSLTCPAPCIDEQGNTVDTAYDSRLTHRVGIYTRSTVPSVNVVKDVRPSDGATTGLFSHEVVAMAKCNQCHNKLSVHDGRTEVQYCVNCHNPGSWDATTGKTVDFRVMIHKIHRSEDLPSVRGPDGDLGTVDDGVYAVGSHDYSDIVYPQDIRNCTKCHDGDISDPNATSEGNNWKTGLSIAACGSCHDNIDFSQTAAPGYDYRTLSVDERTVHSGGPMTGNEPCDLCHTAGGFAGSVEEMHSFPAKLREEAAKYSLDIVSVTNTTPTSMPTITFKITDPTNGDALYDIATTPAITGGSMSVLLGWDSTDINNSGRSNAQPINISLLSGGALAGSVSKNPDGTYSVTSTTALPADATGSGLVGFYARMSVDVDGDGTSDRVSVKSVVDYFPITDAVAVARRRVVEIENCDQCHDQLTLHGGARTDEPQLCVACHNPNATDTARRPVGAPTGTIDNKREESIDFKRMIHGIHSAGFRNTGLVVYGFFSAPATENPVDFSDVRFPGILSDCTTCHTNAADAPAYGTYELQGIWEAPTLSGILGSTVDHGASLTDQSDDLNISPIAAVCSSCHDGDLQKTHMRSNGAVFSDDGSSSTQANILANTILGIGESCPLCHGPGTLMDVKAAHNVP